MRLKFYVTRGLHGGICQDLKEMREEVIWVSEKRTFQAKGILNTNVPWSECMSGILRTATKLVK